MCDSASWLVTPPNDQLFDIQAIKRPESLRANPLLDRWHALQVFKTEQYLDMHLQRKHVHEIPEASTSCLSEWCDVLQCDWFSLYHTIHTSKANAAARREKLLGAGAHCMPHVATRTRQRCEELAQK